MKGILILILLALMIDKMVMLFDPFNQSVTDPPVSNSSFCNGRNRTWGFCSGDPLQRTTTDSCTPITEECDTGTSVASAFVESFITPPSSANPSNQLVGNVGGGSGVGRRRRRRRRRRYSPTTQRPVACSNGPRLQHGSFGNCNRNRVTRSTTNAKRDLMILLDESGSIGIRKFEKVKQIASGIVKLLCDSQRISPNQTRIGVITFDYEVHPYISLLDSNPRLNENLNSITHTIETISYNSSTSHSTCLNKALTYIDQNSFLPSNGGRRDQQNVVQEIIIITDGCANCNRNLASIRNTLASKRTDIYVIGIGLSNQCQTQLQVFCLCFVNMFTTEM